MFLTETELLLHLNIPKDVEAKFVTHVVCEGEKALDCYRSVLEHLHATVTHLTLNFPLNSEVIVRVARTCPRLTYLRVVEAIRDQPVWPADCAITHLIYDDCMGIKYSELALPPRLKVLRISNVGFSFKKEDFSDGRFRDLEELEANGMQIHTKNKEASDLIGEYNAWLTQNSDENLCKVLEEREDDPRLAAVLWDKLYKLALEILPDHFRYMSGALIKQLFALVDNIYFGGSMNLTCPIRSGKCDSSISGITFDNSCVKDTNAGTCQFWSKTNSLIVRMQAKMFLDIPTGSNRSANGLDCNSRLTCFLSVLQHEATHALLDLNCADQVTKTWETYEGHTPTFVKITKLLYGHTDHTHSLMWEQGFTPPKTQEEAHEVLEVATRIVEEDPDRAYRYIKKAWPILEGSAEVEVQTMHTFIQARNNRAAHLAKDTTDPYYAIQLYTDSVDFLEEHFSDEIVALYVVKTRLKLGDLYVLEDESEMAIEQFEDALKKCKPLPGGFRKKIEISMKLGELNDKSVSLKWYTTAAAYAKEGFLLLDKGEGFDWEEYQEYLVSIADGLKKDHPEEAMTHYKAAFEFKDTDKGDMLGRAFSGLAQLTHDHAEASELFGRAEKAYETKSMVERAHILKYIEYYQMKDRSKDTETPMVNLVDTMSKLAKWFEEHGTYAEVNDVCQDVFRFLQRNRITDDDSDARVDTLLLLGGARVTEAEFLLGSSKANAAILLLREAEKELKEVADTVTRNEDDTILHLRSEANDLRAEARSILYKHHKDDSHYKDAIAEYMKRIASDQPVYDGDAWKNMGDLAMMHATTYQHLKARTIEMKKLFADAANYYEKSAEVFSRGIGRGSLSAEAARLRIITEVRALEMDARKGIPDTDIILEIDAHDQPHHEHVVTTALEMGTTQLSLKGCNIDWGKAVEITWDSLTHLIVADAPFRGMRAIKKFCPNLTHLTLDNALHDWAESDTDTPIRELERAELVKMYKLQVMDELGANEEDDEDELKELAETFEQHWDHDTESMFNFLDTWRSYTPFSSITHLTLKNVAFSYTGIMHTCPQLTHLTVENVEFPFYRIMTYVADVDEDDAWPELKIINVLKPVFWGFPDSYTPRDMLDAFNDPLSDRGIELFIGGAKLEKEPFKSMTVHEVADWIRAQARDMGIKEVEGVVSLFKGVNGDAMEKRAFDMHEGIAENQFLSQTDANDLWRRLKLFE